MVHDLVCHGNGGNELISHSLSSTRIEHGEQVWYLLEVLPLQNESDLLMEAHTMEHTDETKQSILADHSAKEAALVQV